MRGVLVQVKFWQEHYMIMVVQFLLDIKPLAKEKFRYSFLHLSVLSIIDVDLSFGAGSAVTLFNQLAYLLQYL